MVNARELFEAMNDVSGVSTSRLCVAVHLKRFETRKSYFEEKVANFHTAASTATVYEKELVL